jgi:uncharacterized protein (TIGR00369 family)
MGRALIEALISGAPFASQLGIRLVETEPDRAVLEMPFKESLVTIADIVHGGAISSLIDTAATAAAWAVTELPENPRGTTVALTVNFVSGAKGVDLTASARVIRRGRSLCYLDVEVVTPAGDLVAKGLVTYKIG